MIKANPQNKRGDKNVINGAKKTMKYVIKSLAYGKTYWQQVNKVLASNNIKNNAQAVTWMYLALISVASIQQAQSTLRKYIDRMERKVEKGKTHENEEYNSRKRDRQIKFIKSAQILLQRATKDNIVKSALCLFEYENCSKKAVEKLEYFLQQNPTLLQEGQSVEVIEQKVIFEQEEEKQSLNRGQGMSEQKQQLSTDEKDQLLDALFFSEAPENIGFMREHDQQYDCFIDEILQDMVI